jgi:hypothetical protein
LSQLQLSNAVVEVEYGDAGAGIHASHRADLYFGPPPASAQTTPVVAAIDGRLIQSSSPAGEKLTAPSCSRGATRWRVRAGQAANGQQCDAGHEGECSKTTNLYLHKETLRVIALFGARIHRRPEYSSVALLLGSSKMR